MNSYYNKHKKVFGNIYFVLLLDRTHDLSDKQQDFDHVVGFLLLEERVKVEEEEEEDGS